MARTLSQCLSLMPGLQMVCRIGRCCLNLSILPRTLSADLRGPTWSEKVLESLYTVLHISVTSASKSSAFRTLNGPIFIWVKVDENVKTDNIFPLIQRENIDKKMLNIIILYKILDVKDWLIQPGVRFGGHDQERGHTSVNRSCVLALRSVTYFMFGWTRLQPRISVGSALVQDGRHSKQTILK